MDEYNVFLRLSEAQLLSTNTPQTSLASSLQSSTITNMDLYNNIIKRSNHTVDKANRTNVQQYRHVLHPQATMANTYSSMMRGSLNCRHFPNELTAHGFGLLPSNNYSTRTHQQRHHQLQQQQQQQQEQQNLHGNSSIFGNITEPFINNNIGRDHPPVSLAHTAAPSLCAIGSMMFPNCFSVDTTGYQDPLQLSNNNNISLNRTYQSSLSSQLQNVLANNINTISQLQQQQRQQNLYRCNSVNGITEPFDNNIIWRNHPNVVSTHTAASTSSATSRSMMFPSCFDDVTIGNQDHFQPLASAYLLNRALRSSSSSHMQNAVQYKDNNHNNNINQDGAWIGMNRSVIPTPNTMANTYTTATTLVEKEDVITERKRTFHETSLLSSCDVVFNEKRKRDSDSSSSTSTSTSCKKLKSGMDGNDGYTFGYNPGILIPLSCPDDDSYTFSGFTKLLRDQIYIFHASQYDICGNSCGRNRPIRLGQIGFVCKHCVHTPPGLRPNGAAYFPSKLKYVYQASINIYHNHLLDSCRNIPSETRQELETLRITKRKGCRKSMWIDSCVKMGIVECGTDEKSYLQFSSVNANITSSASADDNETILKPAIYQPENHEQSEDT